MRTDAEKQQLFKNVFESCSRLVYSVAFSYMKNRSDSNDVMQEVFLKYYKNMDKLSDCGHIKPWLITVTSNICKNTLRSSWFTRIVSEDDLDTVPYEEDFGEESDLFRSVMRLPEKESSTAPVLLRELLHLGNSPYAGSKGIDRACANDAWA